MRFIRFFIAGMIGGLVGAFAWAVVTHFTKVEIGFIAWLVGVLAGVTVRAVSNEDLGSASGAAALVAALLCIVIGKLGVSYLMVRNFNGLLVSAEEATSYIADIVVRDRQRAGQSLQWPAGVNSREAYEASDYPFDVWTEAEARWNAYPATQQDRFLRYPMLLDIEAIQQLLADEVVEEFRRDGREVTVVEEVRDGNPASGPDRYPAEVWKESMRRWDALSQTERDAYERKHIEQMELAYSFMMPLMVVIGAIASVSPWDLLWFALAGVSAWKIGSGASGIMGS